MNSQATPSIPPSNNTAKLLALAAIGLWSTLATLGVSLAHVPPFLLTGLALLIGGLVALPLSRFDLRQWRIPPATLALGVYGLFGYHFLLFTGFQLAPPVAVNLINYLWPLLLVLLAPLILPGLHLKPLHIVAALLGFAGAAGVIAGSATGLGDVFSGRAAWGYAAALGAAVIWSTYSLGTKRVAAFPTAAIGLFCWVSGALSLACHALWEPSVALSASDWALITIMGVGPLGAAFFLWDAALKRGDARQIGVLSFLTPLLSTVLLVVVRGAHPAPSVWAAGALIIAAAVLGARAK